MSSIARRFAQASTELEIARPGLLRRSLALSLGAAAVAVLVALAAVRPTLGPPLAYDTFSSVLHFERIVSGHQLEAGLGTTPKPLLTLALGLAHAAGGWVLVSIVSILVWAAAVGLGTALAVRLAGVVGGAALAAFLVASPAFLLETAWGLASPWALGLWFAAGLAVLAPRPRWGLAGVLLGLATLARLETLLLVGLALGALAVGGLARGGWRPRRWCLPPGRLRLRPSIPPGPWRIGLALFALPVMLVHDALLTGDPFYWWRISSVYGDALASIGALPDAWSAVRQAVDVPLRMPVVSVLALTGTCALVRQRAWPIVLALLALGPGMGVSLVALAASGRFVDPRYLVPIQAAILVAAAIGIGALVALLAARMVPAWSRRAGTTMPARPAGALRRGIAAGVLVLVGAGAALVSSPAIGPLDGPTQATLDRFRVLAHSADVAVPVLAEELDAFRAARSWPGTARLGDRSRSDIFAVPGNLRPRLALDLDVPLTRIVATNPAGMDPARGAPPVGEIVLHSGGDVPAASFEAFEIEAPALVGPVLLMPVLHDAAAATWVVQIASTGGFSSSGGGLRR